MRWIFRKANSRPRRARASLGRLEALEPRLLLTGTAAHELIHLDLFRADERFSDINGAGFSAVVLDWGIDLSHPAFGPDADGDGVADRIVYSWDFADGDSDASDGSATSHGTHVTSILASQAAEYPGVAPGANIIALKIFRDGVRTAELSHIQSALAWVEANVETYNIASVNMSLGADNYSAPETGFLFSDELARLAAKQVIVTAAAGNEFFNFASEPGLAYPAADPSVISVGAVWASNVGTQNFSNGIDYTTSADRIAAYSQRDPVLLDIFAPGGQIAGAVRGGGSIERRGTSMATPHVAGAAVLAQQLAMRELGRRLTLDEFRDLLSVSGAVIHDGDDEDDNVQNTGAAYRRLDMLALGEAILQDPGLPTITVDDLTIAEDAAAGQAVFNVRLSHAAGAPVTVEFATADGDAVADSDYSSTRGVLVFEPGGPLVHSVRVPVLDDGLFEPEESFHFYLWNAQGARLGRVGAEAVIVDDDRVFAWQNPVDPDDANGDGGVSPIDALVIINQLNRTGPQLLNPTPALGEVRFFYDVNGDGGVSPVDALIVINRLNRQAAAAASSNSTSEAAGAVASSVESEHAASESSRFEPMQTAEHSFATMSTTAKGDMGVAGLVSAPELVDSPPRRLDEAPRVDRYTRSAADLALHASSATAFTLTPPRDLSRAGLGDREAPVRIIATDGVIGSREMLDELLPPLIERS